MTDDDLITLYSELIKMMGQTIIERDEQLSSMSHKLYEKDQQIYARDQQLEHLYSKVQNIEQELNSIKESIIWNMTIRFNKNFVLRLLSPYSKKHKWYATGIKGGRVLINEGLGSFWLRYTEYRLNSKRNKKNLRNKNEPDKPLIYENAEIQGLDQFEKKYLNKTSDYTVWHRPISRTPSIANGNSIVVFIYVEYYTSNLKYCIEKILHQIRVLNLKVIILCKHNLEKLDDFKMYDNLLIINNFSQDMNLCGMLSKNGIHPDYMVFLNENSIVSGYDWLYHIIEKMEQTNCFLLINRLIPHSHSNMFTRWLIHRNNKSVLGKINDNLAHENIYPVYACDTDVLTFYSHLNICFTINCNKHEDIIQQNCSYKMIIDAAFRGNKKVMFTNEYPVIFSALSDSDTKLFKSNTGLEMTGLSFEPRIEEIFTEKCNTETDCTDVRMGSNSKLFDELSRFNNIGIDFNFNVYGKRYNLHIVLMKNLNELLKESNSVDFWNNDELSNSLRNMLTYYLNNSESLLFVR